MLRASPTKASKVSLEPTNEFVFKRITRAEWFTVAIGANKGYRPLSLYTYNNTTPLRLDEALFHPGVVMIQSLLTVIHALRLSTITEWLSSYRESHFRVISPFTSDPHSTMIRSLQVVRTFQIVTPFNFLCSVIHSYSDSRLTFYSLYSDSPFTRILSSKDLPFYSDSHFL